MAIYRTVSMSFWTDAKITDDFTPEDRFFYLYLLTNPHTNLCGCYEISIRQMVNEIGYSKESINNLIKRFESVHKIISYSEETKEVLIINWHKYNWNKSPKMIAAIESVAKFIKSKKFRDYIFRLVDDLKNDRVSIPYAYPMDTSDSVSVTVTDTVTDTVADSVTVTDAVESGTDDASQPDVIFEMLWSIYPKKRGKQQVSKKAKQRIADIGYEKMARAIERYASEVAGKDPQYTMYGSTFFNSGYYDYLDENYDPLPTKQEQDLAGIVNWVNNQHKDNEGEILDI